MSRSDIFSGNACAMTVNRLFWNIFGDESSFDTARGVSGNSWMMEANLLAFGSEIVWIKRNDGNAKNVGGVFSDYIDSVETGDVLGIYYKYSLYNKDVDLEKPGIQPNPVGYTHIALVLSTDPVKGPAIAHLYLLKPDVYISGVTEIWPLRIEYLTDFLDAFEGVFEVYSIMRPKNKNSKDISFGE